MHNDRHDAIHHKGVNKNVQEIFHLVEETIVYYLLGVVGVDSQTYDRAEDTAIARGNKSQGDRYTEYSNSQNLLYDLELKEIVGTALHLQDVEVDGMDGIPHQAETDNLQQVDGTLPLVGQHQTDKGVGNGLKASHQRKDDKS